MKITVEISGGILKHGRPLWPGPKKAQNKVINKSVQLPASLGQSYRWFLCSRYIFIPAADAATEYLV